MNAILARLARGYARMWAKVVSLFHKFRVKQKWPTPAQDETHEYYRTQYARLVETLPTLPKGVHHPRAHERRAAILGFAEILDGLHNYGDDPIPPPGVRRILVREARPYENRVRPLLGAATGALGGWQVWLIAGAITLSGWGMAAVQAALKERVENQRDEARRTAQLNAEAARRWQERSEHYRQGLVDAAEVARHAAAALEAERVAAARARARERRRIREIQNVLTGSPEPPAWRLRDDESSEGEPPASR